jgi:hypothetical protein
MVTERELATVLFALRALQSELEQTDDPGEIIDPYGFFDEHTPLDTYEINDLCEKLNVGGA